MKRFLLVACCALTGCFSASSPENVTPSTDTPSPAGVCGDLTVTRGAGIVWAVDSPHEFEEPVVDGDRVVFSTHAPEQDGGGCVAAMSLNGGRFLWRTPIVVGGPPVPVSGGVVLVNSGQETLALDRVTGDVRWRRRAEPFVNLTPQVLGGAALVHDGRGVAAVDPGSNQTLWATAVGAVSAVAAGARVYLSAPIPADGPRMETLAMENGQVRWRVSFDTTNSSVVAATADTVVLMNAPNTLYGLSAATGGVQWKLNVPGSRSPSQGVVGDVMAVQADDGLLYGVRLGTGEVAWRQPLPAGSNQEIVVAGHRAVIVGIDSQSEVVSALDVATGTLAWRTHLDPLAGTKPVADGNSIVVGGRDGSLTRLRLQDGAIDGRVEAGAGRIRPLVLQGRQVLARVESRQLVLANL